MICIGDTCAAARSLALIIEVSRCTSFPNEIPECTATDKLPLLDVEKESAGLRLGRGEGAPASGAVSLFQ